MTKTIVAATGTVSMSYEAGNDNLEAIVAGVKAYRRIYKEALLALTDKGANLTEEFSGDLQSMKEIRVSVFISTIAKAGLAIQCKLFHNDDPVVNVTSVSKLSSVLAAVYDSDEAGLIGKRTKMFEPTLLKAINQPSELTMSQLIKICQAAGIDLSVK